MARFSENEARLNSSGEVFDQSDLSPANASATSPATKFSSSRKLMILFLLILAAVIGIVILELKNRVVSNLGVRLFGLPQVTLQEVFDESPDSESFDHSDLNALLTQNVDKDGWVDYAQLKTEQKQLDAYIETLGAAEIDKLGRDERLAFLINAYNAFTLKLIVEKYPLDSIKEIPDEERWDAARWNVAGEIVSLNQIEHELIRPNFKEPRIHFALVCAAISCPPLRSEAFTGPQLEQQLAEQSSYVHKHATWFALDKNKNELNLTQLYNWYGDDFVQVEGSVQNFAAVQSAELKQYLDSGNRPTVRWAEFDWTLNEKRKRTAR